METMLEVLTTRRGRLQRDFCDCEDRSRLKPVTDGRRSDYCRAIPLERSGKIGVSRNSDSRDTQAQAFYRGI